MLPLALSNGAGSWVNRTAGEFMRRASVRPAHPDCRRLPRPFRLLQYPLFATGKLRGGKRCLWFLIGAPNNGRAAPGGHTLAGASRVLTSTTLASGCFTELRFAGPGFEPRPPSS